MESEAHEEPLPLSAGKTTRATTKDPVPPDLISTLPAKAAAQMLAVEILLADSEALDDDVLESCLYLLCESLYLLCERLQEK